MIELWNLPRENPYLNSINFCVQIAIPSIKTSLTYYKILFVTGIKPRNGFEEQIARLLPAQTQLPTLHKFWGISIMKNVLYKSLTKVAKTSMLSVPSLSLRVIKDSHSCICKTPMLIARFWPEPEKKY